MPVEHRYRLLEGTHIRKGVVARAGVKGQDTLMLTEEGAKTLGDRVERVKTDRSQTGEMETFVDKVVNGVEGRIWGKKEGPEESKVDDRAPYDWSDSQDMNGPDLIEKIKNTDSVASLENLAEIERKENNRIGVLKEIRKRIMQLE